MTPPRPAVAPEPLDPVASSYDAGKLRDAAALAITQQTCWRLNLMRTLAVSAEYAEGLLQQLETHQVIGPPEPSGAPSRTVLVRAEHLHATLDRLPHPEQP